MPKLLMVRINHSHILRAMDDWGELEPKVTNLIAELMGPLLDTELSMAIYDVTTIEVSGVTVLEEDLRAHGRSKRDLLKWTINEATLKRNETSTAGTGFVFVLPADMVQQFSTAVDANLDDGSPLPEWLRFDSGKGEFTATAVPDQAFPIRVRLNWGGQEVLVVISERQP